LAVCGIWGEGLGNQGELWGGLPKRLRARIDLEAARPVDGATATAASLEAIVRALRGDKK